MFRLLFFPIRLSLRILRLSLRFAGFGNAVVLGIGVLIGLLLAPTSGPELRQKLQARLDERRGVDAGGVVAGSGS